MAEHSFHLLRSRFNYKTYDFKDLNKIVIKNDRQINNWFAILIIGISLILFSIYNSIKLFKMLDSGETTHIYIEELLVPFLPTLLGIFCIYAALRTGPALKLMLSNGQAKKFPLIQLKKKNELEPLIKYFKESDVYGPIVSIEL